MSGSWLSSSKPAILCRRSLEIDVFRFNLTVDHAEQDLKLKLSEHQLQDVQWMLDQEMLEGGIMQHVWAEVPPHPSAPKVR